MASEHGRGARLVRRALAMTAVLALGVVILAFTGHKFVHTELIIPAPPEEVWAVITDPASYSEWNPILVHAEGEYKDGAVMRYRMRSEAGKESDINSTVVRFEKGRRLDEFGGIRGIITFEHSWRLTPVEGGTQVVQHEEYRGLGVWFWDPSGVKRQYEQANQALRAHLKKTKGELRKCLRR